MKNIHVTASANGLYKYEAKVWDFAAVTFEDYILYRFKAPNDAVALNIVAGNVLGGYIIDEDTQPIDETSESYIAEEMYDINQEEYDMVLAYVKNMDTGDYIFAASNGEHLGQIQEVDWH